MINDGCGLCVKIAENDKNQALWVKCVPTDNGDVFLRNEDIAPFVVGTKDTDTSWCWGHYFDTLKDAVDYLYRES